ncbi:MAG: DUF998 domain-containing protein [Chloroflexi bacterium]|nr:DUF998 domain-containing protein [Chloroflexota bacterium]
MFTLHRSRETTRRLLTCGLIGAPLFMTVALVEGATRPGYNPWGDYVSKLALSDQGWEQITNFLVTGLLMLGFALGAKRAMPSGRGSTWGPVLLGVYGTGLLLAGVFVIDPGNGYPVGVPAETTLHGTLHTIFGAAAVFLTLPIACFVLSRRWTHGRSGKLWIAYSVATGVLMLAFFVGSWDGPLLGLYQRISIALGWTWIVVLALRLRAAIDDSAAQPTTRSACVEAVA